MGKIVEMVLGCMAPGDVMSAKKPQILSLHQT